MERSVVNTTGTFKSTVSVSNFRHRLKSYITTTTTTTTTNNNNNDNNMSNSCNFSAKIKCGLKCKYY